MKNSISFAFFGTSQFSVIVLEELKKKGFLPSLIVTVPDKPQGRKLILTPPPVKSWAEEEEIPFIQPVSLRTPEVELEIKRVGSSGFDVFIVASYGKIIPENILNIPRHKTLNVHPSLLPKLRGASPIQSSILTEKETGVTIIRLDELEDHGPILAQEKVLIEEWPPYAEELEDILGEKGGEMLANLLPAWLDGKIEEKDQDHSLATKCGKLEKKDGEITLAGDPQENLRKIRAFHMWPGAYFFDKHNGVSKRIVIKMASIENNLLVIERVVPEGKKEMDYNDYLRGKLNQSKNSS